MKIRILVAFVLLVGLVYTAAEAKMDWAGLSKEHIELALPLIIIKGSKGFLACGYVTSETCNRTGEACAIVSGVNTHDDMLTAEIQSVSKRAKELGIKVGMTGKEAVNILR